jgi:hypothetical protein
LGTADAHPCRQIAACAPVAAKRSRIAVALCTLKSIRWTTEKIRVTVLAE